MELKPQKNQITQLIKERCIALTGGIATGKSTVAQILRESGFQVADADEFSRAITAPGSSALSEIAKTFGPDCLNTDHTLNRERLRTIVMSDSAARTRLEAITHPAIQDRFRDWISLHIDMTSDDLFFYEAALIFEVGRESNFCQIWATICPESLQVSRLINRSALTEMEAKAMLAAQMPAALKASKADVVIDTNCDLKNLRQKVKDLAKSIKR